MVELLAGASAALNVSCALCLALGWRAIRRRQVTVHRRWMLAACGSSLLFLVTYLTRVTLFGSRHFAGTGTLRTAYLVLLASHTLLATAVVPLVLRTLWLSAVAGRFDAHRRIARVTFPVWAYVSVTGVLVYALLFHVYP